jgi:arylsulfatase
MERYTVSSSEKLKPGSHDVKFDFAYDGGGIGKGGMGTLFIDGKQVGQSRIERTQSGIFSADETADVGIDLATPVVERIGAEHKSKFNGSIPKLVVEIK